MNYTPAIIKNLTYTHTLALEDGPVWNKVRFNGDGQQLEEDIVRYLDSSNQLEKLEECIEAHKRVLEASRDNGEIEPPLRLIVDVDFTMLADLVPSGLLSDTLLHEPLKARQAFRDVLLCVVRSLGGMPDTAYQQVEVTLRPRSMPLALTRGSITQGTGTRDSGLSVLQGVLVSRTQVRKYIRSAWLVCPTGDCGGAGGERRGGAVLAPGSTCAQCGADVREVASGRIMGEEVRGILVDARALQSQPFARYQGVHVRFRDELTSDLELGVCYNVCGRKDAAGFDAWNAERRLSAAQLRTALGVFEQLPGTIGRLQRESRPSPWALQAIVASRLAANQLPVPAFTNLKMGLLISLATLGGIHPAPILAVGADSASAHCLLSLASHTAPRCVSSPIGCPAGGLARLDEEGCYWSEAGALLLANGGVCYVGDWAKNRLATQRSPILTALESCRVALECQGSTVTCIPTSATPTFPLQAAVWSYWPFDPHRDTSPANHKQLRTLIHVFGMPFLSDAGREEDNVTRHILEEAVSGGKPAIPNLVIPQEELKEYISAAIACKVTLGQRATQLIRDYFVASRRVRPDCLPVGAVSTITALCEGHARLALRDIVTYDDVLAVLCLYEEAISNLFGHCYMTPPPTRNLHNPLQVDSEMRQFGVWLDTYIKSVLGDNLASLLPEE